MPNKEAIEFARVMVSGEYFGEYVEVCPYMLSSKISSVAMLISELLETQELALRNKFLHPDIREQLTKRHKQLLGQSKNFIK